MFTRTLCSPFPHNIHPVIPQSYLPSHFSFSTPRTPRYHHVWELSSSGPDQITPFFPQGPQSATFFCGPPRRLSQFHPLPCTVLPSCEKLFGFQLSLWLLGGNFCPPPPQLLTSLLKAFFNNRSPTLSNFLAWPVSSRRPLTHPPHGKITPPREIHFHP